MRVLPKLDSLDAETLDLGAYLFATERNLFLKSVERSKRQQPVDEIPEPTSRGRSRTTRSARRSSPTSRSVCAGRTRRSLRASASSSPCASSRTAATPRSASSSGSRRTRSRSSSHARGSGCARSCGSSRSTARSCPRSARHCSRSLSAYLDGQLKGQDAERTLAHVESCELCQKALTEMREASRLYRALIPIPFPELFGRIDDALASSGFWNGPPRAPSRARAQQGRLDRGRHRRRLARARPRARRAAPARRRRARRRTGRDPGRRRRRPTRRLPTRPSAGHAHASRRRARRVRACPYAARAQDDVDGAVEVSCAPASGGLFAIGTTEVVVLRAGRGRQRGGGHVRRGGRRLDRAGRDASGFLRGRGDGAGGSARRVPGAGVAIVRTASLAVRCAPRRGDVLPLGETTVECTARDARATSRAGASPSPCSTRRRPLSLSPRRSPSRPVLRSRTRRAPATRSTARSAADCSVPSGRILPLGTTDGRLHERGRRGQRRAEELRRAGRRHDRADAPAPGRSDRRGDGVSGRASRTRRRPASAEAARSRCAADPRLALALRARQQTTVRCSAADAQGNAVRGSFAVTVVDTTAPRLVVPSPLTVEATGRDRREGRVPGDGEGSSSPSGRSVSCSPASGSTFPLGATTVRCSARDASGNRADGIVPGHRGRHDGARADAPGEPHACKRRARRARR